MSEDVRPPGQAQSLRRAFALRIGSALAVLIALGGLALHYGSQQGPPNAPVLASKPEPAATASAPGPPSAEPAPADTSASGRIATPEAGAERVKEAEGGSAARAEPNTSDTSNTSAPTSAQTPSQGAPEKSAAADTVTGDTGLPTTASAVSQAADKSIDTPDKTAPSERPPGAGKPPRGTYLQAGVFMQPANAQAFKATLESQGLPVFVESRVHIGPFQDRKEAERVREKLRESGLTTVLISQ